MAMSQAKSETPLKDELIHDSNRIEPKKCQKLSCCFITTSPFEKNQICVLRPLKSQVHIKPLP